MVGILVDAARLNRTREEFAEIFDVLQGFFTENLRELKGAKMIFGRDRWRNVDPALRKRVAEYLCNWIVTRKHTLLLSAVDRAKLASAAESPVKNDEWLAAGLHVALQVQKSCQSAKKHKGHTFLIFDENKAKADALSELLWQPNPWTDDYYAKTKKQERLDQLIDSAFTVKSHHAGLVQVADLFALIFRRYAELADFGTPETWAGERELINDYVTLMTPRLASRASRWPVKTTSESARWFNSIAPNSLMALGK